VGLTHIMQPNRATIVREALLSDAVEVVSLISELGYSVTEQFVRDRLTQVSSNSADVVFIADCAGGIAGFLSFHLLPLLHVDGNLGRITALAVSSRFRRCGIGRKLIAAAEGFAWARRCVRVEITSGDHRPEAHAFYEAVGYRQETRRFLKSHP